MAFHRLEVAGVVEKGKYKLMSVGSCRKGGCSGACAYGVRDVLREKHGRWGLTARKKLGATAEPEYNVQLSSERGQVMKALNALLNGWLPGKEVSGVCRDSGASGAAVRASVQAGAKGKGRGIAQGRGRSRGRSTGKTSGRGSNKGTGRAAGRQRR